MLLLFVLYKWRTDQPVSVPLPSDWLPPFALNSIRATACARSVNVLTQVSAPPVSPSNEVKGCSTDKQMTMVNTSCSISSSHPRKRQREAPGTVLAAQCPKRRFNPASVLPPLPVYQIQLRLESLNDRTKESAPSFHHHAV